ncbi:MAG: hypothetical protein R3F41_11060 [Gammaproteobacteria bacterium]|nr:hypothetical protein [Pseudomonadales bacterium]MCP5348148.1 hypothetical protein [Pseudomonadales bacterium]
MNWDAIGAIAEVVGGLGVIATLFYLSIQIRGSNRIASAQSRQSMSEFASAISRFRAENADRYARIATGGELSAGDREFQYWSHMQMLIYGETHFHQYQLGLMPESHWQGFASFLVSYIESKGFEDFWNREATSFSQDYTAWINDQIKARGNK